MSTKLQGEIVLELLRKYPDTPSKTLAEIAYKENPNVWTNLETARSCVKYYRGNNGKKHLDKLADKTFVRDPQKPYNPFPSLPEPLKHFENWNAFTITGEIKALILADIHLPYFDKTALDIGIKTGIDQGVNMVLLNGDAFDFYSVSPWEKDPRKRKLSEELKIGEQFLQYLRHSFPKARIILKVGNHEERWERYLWVKAPDLCGIEHFEFHHFCNLSNYGLEYVKDKRIIQLGKLNVIHGHEYRFVISNPVNPAYGIYRRAKDLCLASHFHRRSQHSTMTIDQKVITCWSTGCLCDMHPEYAPLNEWTSGFAIVEVDKQGAFRINNYVIIDGAIWT